MTSLSSTHQGLTQVYGAQGTPIPGVFQPPVIATRDPTTTDINYKIGRQWINKSTPTSWVLGAKSGGSANWLPMAVSGGGVVTLTGDAGGAISPVLGDIVLAGGTNLATSGAGNTVTFNLDPAISLATSVTSPIYTVAAATDLNINAVAGQDIIVKMGDAAGANKVSFVDSASAEVAAIDSNGGFSMGAITFSGLLTANASATINTAGTALNLATDATTDTVNIATGAAARTVHIADSAHAHVLTLGSTTGAAATTISAGTGNVLVQGAATTTMTVGTGLTTGTITLGATGNTGTMTISPSTGTQTVNIANADGAKTINVGSGVSGNTVSVANGINTSAQVVNISGGASAANSTVNILSGNGSAGTQTLNALTGTRAGALNLATGSAAHTVAVGSASAGAVTVDTAAGISLDAATASNFTVTGAADLTLRSTLGSVVVNAEEAAADALRLVSAAGGMDVNTALQINVDSSQAAVDAIRITSSNAAGGLDVDAGTGGITVDTTGALSLDSAAASNFTVTGAFDLTLATTLGSVNINAGEAASDAIKLNASNAAGGITLQTGGGDITISNTVKQVNTEFTTNSGDDLTFQDNPIVYLSGNAPALPTGATGTVNLMNGRNYVMEQFILGAGQTIIAPVMSTAGLLVSGDLTVAEGFEYNWGAARLNSRHAFTIGTSPAFFFEMKYTVADVSGASPYMIGFRKVEANNATLTSYTDYAMIGLDAIAAVGTVVLKTELNSGGTTNTNTTDAWTDGQSHTVKILVSAAGVVTYTIDGLAPTVTAAFTFDNADVVVPFFRLEHAAVAPGTVQWETLKVGFQA